MVTNDRLFPVYCINPAYISCYLKKTAWVASKGKTAHLSHSGCCTLSQTETSQKEEGELLLSSNGKLSSAEHSEHRREKTVRERAP